MKCLCSPKKSLIETMHVKVLHYLCSVITNLSRMGTDVNRLKVVLAEKKRTNKWLCEQLGGKPVNCLQMVYEQFTARFADTCQDSKAVRGNCR